MKCRVVEILFTERCPFLREAIERVRAATETRPQAAGADVEVRLVLVETPSEARALHFLGSPTVRVDGRDVEPNVRSTMFGLHSRGYFVDGHVERAPPADWIARAL
jgi:hypothetical protein